jgi:hypothetical protein
VADLYPFVHESARGYVFVDGEDLAMRYGEMLGGVPPPQNMESWYRPDVAVWAQELSPPSGTITSRVIRKYYFTSVQGDEGKRTATVDWL